MEAFTMIRLLRLLFVIAAATGLHHPSTKVSPLPSDQPDDHLVNRPGDVSASRPRRQQFMIVGLRYSGLHVINALDVTEVIVERQLEVMCLSVTCIQALPKKGDIIRFPRDLGYSHYGIYIGNGEVIHRSGDLDVLASPMSFSGAKNSKVSIRVNKLEDIVGDGLEAQISNYLDDEIMPYSKEEIVKRAKSKLGEPGYNILLQNCEHFVTWCRYGKEISQQVLPKKGDIIRFPRSVFDHYGIYVGDGKVIHMASVQGVGPVCLAAITSGIKSTKGTIRMDDLKDVIGQSGKAEIANYLDGLSKPFSSEEIVKRAREKLGEGDYSVMTNNCEHFVTWCRYGEAISKQVDNFKKIGAAVVASPVTFLIKQLLETSPKTSATVLQ